MKKWMAELKRKTAVGMAVVLLAGAMPAMAFAAEVPASGQTENGADEEPAAKPAQDGAGMEAAVEPVQVRSAAVPLKKTRGAEGGSSNYVLDFSSDGRKYTLSGGVSVSMSGILDELGITGEATDVEVSDGTLFSAYKEAGEWRVRALMSFTGDEWLKATVGNETREITVTCTQGVGIQCGDDVFIRIGKDPEGDTLRVWGKDPMWDGKYIGVAEGTRPSFWEEYLKVSSGGEKILIIEEGVTSVGDFAFHYCGLGSGHGGAYPYIWKVFFPDTLERIGKGAFSQCYRLGSQTETTIPASVRIIDDGAFAECGLEKLIMPDRDFLVIGEKAFKGNSLLSLDLPEGLAEVGFEAFAYADNNGITAEDLHLPQSLKVIGDRAFFNVLRESERLVLPDGIEKIGNRAFTFAPKQKSYIEIGIEIGGRVDEVVLPRTLKSIGNWVFYEDDHPELAPRIIVPEGGIAFKEIVGYRKEYDKYGNLYEDSYINDSAFGKPHNVFRNGWSGGPIILSGENVKVASSAFEGVNDPNAKLILEEGVTLSEVGENAFKNCTLIGCGEFSVGTVGEQAFQGCTGLTGRIKLKGDSISTNAFRDSIGLTGIEIQGSRKMEIGESAFEGCTNIEGNLILPLNHHSIDIEANAFKGCEKLESLETPSFTHESYLKVGDNAFENCTGLKTVVISNSRYIGDEAFKGCTGLEKAVLPDIVPVYGILSKPGTETNLSLMKFGSSVFSGCTRLKELKGSFLVRYNYSMPFKDDNSRIISMINNNLMSEEDVVLTPSLCQGCTSLEEYKVPAGTAKIDRECFSGCEGLKKITIPSGVRFIEEDAFKDCTALENIYFEGDQVSWNSISIKDQGNDRLKSVSVNFHYNCGGYQTIGRIGIVVKGEGNVRVENEWESNKRFVNKDGLIRAGGYGQPVKVYAEPDEGYQLNSIKFTSDNGHEILYHITGGPWSINST